MTSRNVIPKQVTSRIDGIKIRAGAIGDHSKQALFYIHGVKSKKKKVSIMF